MSVMMYEDFIESDIRIFPLWAIDDNGYCGCGNPECHVDVEDSPAGKHPRASNWQHSPEWSEDQIEAMEESGQFDTGYGVVVSGLLVVDVDERNGGAESYAKLLENIPSVAGSGFIVRTGSGGESKHLYFRLPEKAPLVQHLDGYDGLDFKSTGYVVGPGSLHKSGNRYEVLSGSPSDIDDAPADLVEMLRKPERHRATVNGQYVDVSVDEVRDMLSAVDPDSDHETWVRCGMAVHHATGGTAFDVWDEWSAKGEKYPGHDTLAKRWHSFGKAVNPVTLGTLAHHAESSGWVAPVTFTSDMHFEVEEEGASGDIDTSGVDLTRPPGFAGKLAAWINARNRHAREHLATAAALSAISTVAGMRYVDPLDGITPNVFLFGVAGSATGKESVLKSLQELLKAAGVSAAVHGAIKSEQEIFRNLVRHQAASYVMDEMGEQLQKIQNARKKGGSASYLEGIIGAVLSLYSKANSHALITGDLKEEVKKSIQAELAAANKALDEGKGSEEKVQMLTKQLDSIENGLENPYLCIFGLTTPEKFNDIMDYDMAANGFMGRSLIFRELEDNPRSKPRGKVKRGPVPDDIQAALMELYAPGYSHPPERVGRVGDVVEVPTRPDAEDMLDKVEARFWEMAESAKDQTGLTAIPRRGYEQVAKVSMILAIPEGLRTAEHVKWAYALIKRDIDEKMKLAHSNSAVDKADALASKIMGQVTEEHGETAGRLRDRCREYRKEDVNECIDRLVEAGHLRIDEYKPNRGRPSKKYFAVTR